MNYDDMRPTGRAWDLGDFGAMEPETGTNVMHFNGIVFRHRYSTGAGWETMEPEGDGSWHTWHSLLEESYLIEVSNEGPSRAYVLQDESTQWVLWTGLPWTNKPSTKTAIASKAQLDRIHESLWPALIDSRPINGDAPNREAASGGLAAAAAAIAARRARKAGTQSTVQGEVTERAAAAAHRVASYLRARSVDGYLVAEADGNQLTTWDLSDVIKAVRD